eukprot:1136633-Pelagomonas_calceolata.AAC.2
MRGPGRPAPAEGNESNPLVDGCKRKHKKEMSCVQKEADPWLNSCNTWKQINKQHSGGCAALWAEVQYRAEAVPQPLWDFVSWRPIWYRGGADFGLKCGYGSKQKGSMQGQHLMLRFCGGSGWSGVRMEARQGW